MLNEEYGKLIAEQDRKSLDDVNQDLKYLESKGYRYVFIDEVTLLDDFIGGPPCFPMYLRPVE